MKPLRGVKSAPSECEPDLANQVAVPRYCSCKYSYQAMGSAVSHSVTGLSSNTQQPQAPRKTAQRLHVHTAPHQLLVRRKSNVLPRIAHLQQPSHDELLLLVTPVGWQHPHFAPDDCIITAARFQCVLSGSSLKHYQALEEHRSAALAAGDRFRNLLQASKAQLQLGGAHSRPRCLHCCTAS